MRKALAIKVRRVQASAGECRRCETRTELSFGVDRQHGNR
jgi:hypothetical protein